MVPDFKIALFAAGALLFLIGVMAEVGYLASQTGESGFVELFSYGMKSTIFAFFSGVLIGAGVALAADSVLLGMQRKAARIAFLALLSATALCIAMVAFFQNSGEQQIIYLVALFASLSSFVMFTISIIVTVACVFGGKLVDEMGAPEPAQSRRK